MRLFPGCCACAMYSAKPLAISTAIAKIRVLFMRTPIDARSRRTFRAPKFSALPQNQPAGLFCKVSRQGSSWTKGQHFTRIHMQKAFVLVRFGH